MCNILCMVAFGVWDSDLASESEQLVLFYRYGFDLIRMYRLLGRLVLETSHDFKCGSRRGQGVRTPPLQNFKNIRFLSNIGLNPLKITTLQIQHSMLGHHRHTSETPFKWRFAGWPLMVRPAYSGIWILAKVDPSDITFWIRAWILY